MRIEDSPSYHPASSPPRMCANSSKTKTVGSKRLQGALHVYYTNAVVDGTLGKIFTELVVEDYQYFTNREDFEELIKAQPASGADVALYLKHKGVNLPN